MDERDGLECGRWDVRSYEWPRVRVDVRTAVDVEHIGWWDARSYGWPELRCVGGFDVMDVVSRTVEFHGH